jgi:elongation factor P
LFHRHLSAEGETNRAWAKPFAFGIIRPIFAKEKAITMIDVNDLRKGVTFELDGKLYKVLEYSHNKPGRGNATIRTKARDLRTGNIMEKTFQSGDRVQDIRLDHHQASYLYTDGTFYHFMDTETFDQPAIPKVVVGENEPFLKEGLEVKLTFFNGEALDVELPASVDLKVVEAEFGLKGDTATGATKGVTTETGLRVLVPLFVNPGDTIRVDTRSGEYLTRA